MFGLTQLPVRVKQGLPPLLAQAYTKVQRGVLSEGPTLPNRGIFRGLGRLPVACRGHALLHCSCGKVLGVPRIQWPSCYTVIGWRGLPALVEHLHTVVLWTV